MARLRLSSSELPTSTHLLGFEGREALSTLFAFDVWFSIDGAQPEPPNLVGKVATIAIEARDTLASTVAPHVFAGVFADVELLVELKERALYKATIVPRLAITDLSHHSRIWTKTPIKDVLSEVLSGYGLDFDFRVKAPPAEEHVCQYKESDYAFFSRWLEREGWYYYFEHDEGKDTLVIVDDLGKHQIVRTAGPIRYFPGSAGTTYAAEAFEDFASASEAVPGGVTVADYDYANPRRPLMHAANLPDGGVSKIVDYGARAFTNDDVTKVAKVRAEQLNILQHVHKGTGAATQVTTGTLFELSEHPAAALNRKYLVVEAVHAGWEPSSAGTWGDDLPTPSTEQSYRVEVSALPADVQYRHPANTAWPRIDGFELATVCGAASSQYAQIDDHGRYAIKFKFDEGTLKDGKASTLVRMMQPHGGSLEGWHFPLRKNTEVICSFLGGDVDRPIIQAIVPNPDTPSPVTSANHTQNMIHTGGNTYLTMEDQQGVEFVNLFTPKSSAGLYLGTPRGGGGRDRTSNAAPVVPPAGPGGLGLSSFSFDLRTDDGNAQLHTGKNMDVRAHGQLQVIAGADTNITHFGKLDKDVIGNSDEKYAKKLKKRVAKKVTVRHDNTHDLHVLGQCRQTYHAVFDMCVGAAADQTMLTGWCEEITGSPGELNFNSCHSRTIVGPLTLEIKPQSHIHIGGDLEQTITGGRTETVTGKVMWDVGGKVTFNTLNDNEDTRSRETDHKDNAVELTFPFKLDIAQLHKEKWTLPHIELTAALASATVVSLETGFNLNLTLRGGGQASAVGIQTELLGAYIAMMAKRFVVETSTQYVTGFYLLAKATFLVI